MTMEPPVSLDAEAIRKYFASRGRIFTRVEPLVIPDAVAVAWAAAPPPTASGLNPLLHGTTATTTAHCQQGWQDQRGKRPGRQPPAAQHQEQRANGERHGDGHPQHGSQCKHGQDPDPHRQR
jgi:hypothetical protein